MGAGIEVVCKVSSSSNEDVVDTCGNMSAPRALDGMAPSCKQKLCVTPLGGCELPSKLLV